VSHRHALACDDCRELLGGYVLDALEPDETDAVRAHLAACPACLREHAGLARLPALLEAAGPAEVAPAKPPPSLEDVVVEGFARERRPVPRRRHRWLARPIPVAVAAAAAAVLITLVVSNGLDGGSPPHTYSALLRASAAAPGARAYARLASVPSGTRVQLDVSGVRPEPGAVYQLWCLEDGGMRVSAGTFRVNDAGRANVRLTTAARLGEYHRLSVERTGPAPDSGQQVLAGSIEY
jgi:anti-sigma factor RsiW